MGQRFPLDEFRRSHPSVLARRIAGGVVSRVGPVVHLVGNRLAIRRVQARVPDPGLAAGNQDTFHLSYGNLHSLPLNEDIHRFVRIGEMRTPSQRNGNRAVQARRQDLGTHGLQPFHRINQTVHQGVRPTRDGKRRRRPPNPYQNHQPAMPSIPSKDLIEADALGRGQRPLRHPRQEKHPSRTQHP